MSESELIVMAEKSDKMQNIVSSATVKVFTSNELPNPRESGGNIGTILCWDKRGYLGDRNTISDDVMCDPFTPHGMFVELALNTVMADEIYAYLAKGSAKGLRVQEDSRSRAVTLLHYWEPTQQWLEILTVDTDEPNMLAWLCEAAMKRMSSAELLPLVEAGNIIMPVYFSERGDRRLQVEPFNNESGDAAAHIGYIYVMKYDAEKAYGDLSPKESLDRVKQRLIGEIDAYSEYLRNERYGFEISGDGKPADIVAGFSGDLDEVRHELERRLAERVTDVYDTVARRNNVCNPPGEREGEGLGDGEPGEGDPEADDPEDEEDQEA